MTKNLSHELLALKAVLLMRLIDKKESKEKMLERYLSCSDKVLKGYIEHFFEDEDEVVLDEDEETYTSASAHDHSLSHRDVPEMVASTPSPKKGESMKIEILFEGSNPSECIDSIRVCVDGTEHCLEWDLSQFFAGDTRGRGVYLDGAYVNDRLDFLRKAKVMSVSAVDVSLEEDDERSVALDRIKKVTLTEGNDEIQLAIHNCNKEGSYAV